METPPPFASHERPDVAAGTAPTAEVEAAQAAATGGGSDAYGAAQPASSPVQELRLAGDVADRIEELLRNAEAEGYLRGRNDAIEASRHFDPDPDPDLEPQADGLPRYCRRSVWDS